MYLSALEIFISSCDYYLHQTHLHYTVSSPFSIAYREGLVVMSLLSVCLPRNVLVSPSFGRADGEFLVNSSLYHPTAS